MLIWPPIYFAAKCPKKEPEQIHHALSSLICRNTGTQPRRWAALGQKPRATFANDSRVLTSFLWKAQGFLDSHIVPQSILHHTLMIKVVWSRYICRTIGGETTLVSRGHCSHLFYLLYWHRVALLFCFVLFCTQVLSQTQNQCPQCPICSRQSIVLEDELSGCLEPPPQHHLPVSHL